MAVLYEPHAWHLLPMKWNRVLCAPHRQSLHVMSTALLASSGGKGVEAISASRSRCMAAMLSKDWLHEGHVYLPGATGQGRQSVRTPNGGFRSSCFVGGTL